MMGDLSVALMVVVLSRHVLISELIKLYKYVQLFIYRSYLNKVVLKIRRIEKRRNRRAESDTSELGSGATFWHTSF